MAKKNPVDIYTDLNVHGNKLIGAKVDKPTRNDEVANKGYVDSQFILDTPDAQRLRTAKIDLGGIKEGDTVSGILLTNLLTKALFPIIQPKHNEATSSIEPKITKLLVGQRYQHRSKFVCTLNDRIRFESRVGCYCIYPDSNQTSTNYFEVEDAREIDCTHPEVIIDTRGKTRFVYSVQLSRTQPKLNSHGYPEDESSFTVSKRVIEELKYLPVLPALYKISNSDNIRTFDITFGDRLFNDIKSNMTMITQLEKYVDGIDWTDISFILPINNLNQGSIVQALVPGEPLLIEVNGFDIMDCSVISYKNIQLDQYSQPVMYAAIKFNSGSFAFSKAANVKIRYKSNGVFYDESTILIQQNNSTMGDISSNGSSGHVIVDQNDQSYPNRRKLKMMNVTIRDNDSSDETIVITPRLDTIDPGTYDN